MEIPNNTTPPVVMQPTQASLNALGLGKNTAVQAVQTVVKTPVAVKKKGFWSNIIQNDFKTIRESVMQNVLWPGVRTFICNLGYGFINATFNKGGVVGPANYWNYYNNGKTANLGWNPLPNNSWNAFKPQSGGQMPSMTAGGMTSLSDYKTIEFQSIEDAQFVFTEMAKRIAEVGKVSVRFMFDKCNLSSNDVTLDNWGWYDLNCGFNVMPLTNGRYHLTLPEPVNFNVNRT